MKYKFSIFQLNKFKCFYENIKRFLKVEQSTMKVDVKGTVMVE